MPRINVKHGAHCLAVGAVLAWSTLGRAQTLVTGGVVANEIWTAASSPYLVSGDITVPEGAFLSLEPGTWVVVQDDDSLSAGRDENLIEITVQGELYVNGTLNAPVRLWNENSTAPSAWYGFVLESQVTRARFTYAELANADFAIHSMAPAANVEIVASTFHTCYVGLYLFGGAARLDRVLAHHSQYGVWIDAVGTTLTNFIAHDNDQGLFIARSDVAIYNATIVNNTVGILASVRANVTLANSILANNSPQTRTLVNATFAVSHSNFWPLAPDARVTVGAGMISVDPEFVNAPDDFSLRETSQCIDAGSTGVGPPHDFVRTVRPLDGDGDGDAVPDMGAYELFRRARCGDGHVDSSEACDDGDANGIYGFCTEDCSGRGPFCGDNHIDPPQEVCDDGGVVNGDGCDASCGLERPGGTGGVGGSGAAGAGGLAGSAAGMGGFGGPAGNAGSSSIAGASMGGGGTGGSDVDDGGSDTNGGSGATGGSNIGGGDSGTGAVDGGGAPDTEPGTAGDSSGGAGVECDGSARSACTCPDGSTGVRTCDDDGSAICNCSVVKVTKGEGCGCRTVGKTHPVGAWLGVLGLSALALRRRSTRQACPLVAFSCSQKNRPAKNSAS